MLGKRPVYINCKDLDGTLIETNNLWIRFESEMKKEIMVCVSLHQLFDSWLKNHFAKPGEDLEKLIADYVIDSPNGKLAKAIKHALSLGDRFAIVTFNTSINYAKFSLALMGLTKEEIEKVFIRYRDTEVCPEDKNGYIMEAVAHFGCTEIIEAAEADARKLKDPSYPYISLLDDSPANCDAAEGIGINSFFVQHANRTGHIRVYCEYLHQDDKKYLDVKLPTAAERFELAKSLVELEQEVVTPALVVSTPVPAPSAVQQILAQIDALQAQSNDSKKRKTLDDSDIKASTSAIAFSLRCDEETLGSDIALDAHVDAAAKKGRYALRSQSNRPQTVRIRG